MEISGLTSQEVSERRAAGQSNDYENQASRSYLDIVAKNLLTPFNIVLFILAIALYVINDDRTQGLINAFSACGVIVFNVLISTVQEIRAKRRLDRIALLMRPHVAVVRDGEEREVDRAEIVLGDVVHLRPGDQAQVDGTVLKERSMEMDESLLTGESSTRRKRYGDSVYSGAYCVAGECWFEVTKVGKDTFSAEMLSNARTFRKKKTPLQTETNAVTTLLMGLAFVFLAILVVRNVVFGKPLADTLESAVIVLDIVPIALFLLITLTYMISAVRMADTGVLLQDSSSVESMSHVDTVCMDKTGTITTNNLVFDDIYHYSDDRERTERLIREFTGTTGSRNRTVEAIAKRFGSEECYVVDEVQFTSERKYSAVRVRSGSGYDTIVMGAWSALRPRVGDPLGVDDTLRLLSESGRRSVVFCSGGDTPLHEGDEPILPELEVLAVIAITDEVRPDCQEILQSFSDHGMDVKVISGDDPDAVASLFRLAGIRGDMSTVSGDQLETLDERAYSETVCKTKIFGRMKPEQKERVIDALRRERRYVAYVGDGINDVRSIKKANVGVSVQSGAGAARGVADMVLMNDDFKALPKAIIEGKRTVSGMRDILRLYLTRNFVLAFLVLVLLIVLWKSPMMPIQNTLYALLTVSIASFLLALWAKPSENSDLVLPNVMRYVVPASLATVCFGFLVYGVVWGITDMGLLDLTDVYNDTIRPMNEIGRWNDHAPEWSENRSFLDNMGADANEINARNFMLLFLIMAGISQLLVLFPPSKNPSPDDGRGRDVKPFLLALLLFGLLIGLYALPKICVGITQLIPIPWGYWAPMALLVAAWMCIVRWLMRWRRLDVISDRVESALRNHMAKELDKES